GARVGGGYFPPDVAAEIRKLLNPINITSVSQAMATAAMDDQTHLQQVVAQTSDIRNKFARDLRELRIQVPSSYTKFVLLRFDTPEVAGMVDQALRAQGLLMRGMAGYGLPNCLRATICAPDVMERALIVFRQGMG
ncbi:MAG: histidinol-phosphate/aromatic aminotransferase/cobyric acid decarboxylase-like protein, partial [Paracoccaceae bacterium]